LLYAGVAPSKPAHLAGVLRLAAVAASAISLDGIVNAFSGDANAMVNGGLYSLTGSGFQFPATDLGLNAAQDLPSALGGVQVLIDGVPAPLLQTGTDRVIAAAPVLPPPGRLFSASPGFRQVQLVSNGIKSNAVWMPVSDSLPGLLTAAFPGAPSATGVIRNEDGTLNDMDHPAAVGSTVTVFATGLGVTNPPLDPGAPANSAAALNPVLPVYPSWQAFDPIASPPSAMVNLVQGFVSAMEQIQLQLPGSVASLYGTSVGNGVVQATFGVQFRVIFEPVPPTSNEITIYVK
jgi:uncharacterized protein (TIGR03437 family)